MLNVDNDMINIKLFENNLCLLCELKTYSIKIFKINMHHNHNHIYQSGSFSQLQL